MRSSARACSTLVLLVPLLIPLPSAGAATTSDGALETSFGKNGRVFVDDGSYSSIDVMPDGRVVVGGSVTARYRIDGSLDPTFGTGGIVADSGGSVDVTADGTVTYLQGQTVRRLTPSGDPDTGFSGDGILTLDDGLGLMDLAVADQGIYVTGMNGGSVVGIYRVTEAGVPDPTFGGGDGLSTVDFSDITTDLVASYSVSVYPDGRSVIGGWAGPQYYQADFMVARFEADGDLDATFDGDGRAITDLGVGDGTAFGGEVTALAGGGVLMCGGVPFWGDMGIVRWTSAGALDTSFGGGDGLATFNGYSDAWREQCRSISVQPDGKLVATGYNGDASGAGWALVARMRPNGTADPTFGGGDGLVVVENRPSQGQLEFFGGAIRPDGRLIVTAAEHGPTEPRIALYGFRLDADPPELAIRGGDTVRTYDVGGDAATDLGSDAAPMTVGAGRIVVPVADGSGGFDLVGRNARTGAELFTIPDGTSPVFAPDGAWLAFARPSANAVYRFDVGTGALTRIARFSGDGVPLSLAVSPDGARVAIGQGIAGRSSDLWLVRSGGGSLRRLTSDGRSWSPSFSPDGRMLTFATARRSDPCATQIRTIGVDGSGGRLLAAGTCARRLSRPVWATSTTVLARWSDADGSVGIRRITVLAGGEVEVTTLAKGEPGVFQVSRTDRLVAWRIPNGSIRLYSLRAGAFTEAPSTDLGGTTITIEDALESL
jgi:uncharacterized delta-60 repeat protein